MTIQTRQVAFERQDCRIRDTHRIKPNIVSLSQEPPTDRLNTLLEAIDAATQADAWVFHSRMAGKVETRCAGENVGVSEYHSEVQA